MNVQAIVDWLDLHGYDPFCYSGRGMYGDQCLAISSQNGEELTSSGIMGLGYWIGEASAEMGDDLPARELVTNPHSTDRLGRGIVVYWPALRWPEASTA